MIELIALVIIFWTPVTIVLVKKYLWDLYYWQIKEYRWDRFWTHLRWDQDEHNRNYFIVGIKFVLFSLVTLMFESPVLAMIGIAIAYSLWVFESFEFITDLLNKKIVKPALKNIRNVLIMVIIMFLSFLVPALITFPFTVFERAAAEYGSDTVGYFVEKFTDISSQTFPDVFILIGLLTMFGLFLDLAAPFIVPIGVFLTWPLAKIKRERIVMKGKEKFDSLKNDLTLIAITGSQGKTTTKEILYEILSTKYKVAKTPENYNTDVGVATAMMTELKNDTEIFIAEMGAYRKGEIKKMVTNFPPDIGVITDIDTQHLGIFGGKNNLKVAKSEIVRYMKGNGIAILNGDNAQIRDVAETLQNFVGLVSSEKENFELLDKFEDPKKKYIKATNIKSTKTTLSFTVVDNDTKEEVKLKNYGEHLVNNLLIALSIATRLDMTLKEAISALEKSKLTLPRLVTETGDNETIVLNDSYSSSYKGFIAAVNQMDKVRKNKSSKRILITKGILELGKDKKTIYKKLVHNVREKIDVVISTDTLLLDLFMHENIDIEIIKVKSPEEMIYEFRRNAEPNDVVLLEGRLHPKVIQAVVSDKM